MTIIHKHIDDIFEYDGSQINPSWAFNEFGIYGSSIITWVGPVNITPGNLKDFADVGLEIKSNYMINFICEFFWLPACKYENSLPSSKIACHDFYRSSFEKGIVSKREGDDIFVENRKLSISIASASLSSMKIHFALNLEDKGTPDDVETIGLFDIKDKNGNQIFNKDNLTELVNDVAGRYIDELETIEKILAKLTYYRMVILWKLWLTVYNQI